MQFVLLFSILLIGAANGQLSGSRDQECKDNESFNSCGTACEPSCENPNPSFCTLQCVIGCQCEKGFLRRSDKKCVKQEDCKVATPQILPAPTPTCPANEFANECHNPCTEKKCPVKNAPLVNCLMACTNGCSCQKGYLRNNKGQCVKEADCPPIDNSEDQCNLVDCATGLKCAIQNGKPTCIPGYNDLPSDNYTISHPDNSTDFNIQITPCSTIRCSSGTECQDKFLNCSKPPCKMIGECVPNNTTLVDDLAGGCATMRCSAGTTCQEALVKCAKAPCPKHAMCVPYTTQNSTLGGCASMTCPVGETCEEQVIECFGSIPCPTHAMCMPPQTDCATTKCRAGTTCQEVLVNCIKAPCPTHAMCAPDTPLNEPVSSCASTSCMVGEICQEAMVKCAKPPCPGRAICIPAVTQDDNSTAVSSGCATMKCKAGQICVEALVKCAKAPCTSQGKCVADTTQNSTLSGCASVTCPVGETCEEQEVACFVAPCPIQPICVTNIPDMYLQGAIANKCTNTTCPDGWTCELSTVQCFQPPCPKLVNCLRPGSPPNREPIECGNWDCSYGETCADTVVDCDTPPCFRSASCVPHNFLKNKVLGGCANVTCPNGEKCEETDMECLMAPCPKLVTCVPQTINLHEPAILTSPRIVTCPSGDILTCPSGEVCKETPVDCKKPPCSPYVSCVPDSITSYTINGGCAKVKCPNRESCVEQEMACLMAPCPKAVSCVPLDINKNSTARQGCDVVKCRANEICEEQVVACLKAPCPIQVVCVSIIHTNGTAPTTNSTVNPTCPKNQTMSDCLNHCSEAKCPGIEVGMICTKHCGQGCACAKGYLRSSDGECYKEKDCPSEQVCGQNEEYRCEKCAGTCKNPEPNCPGPKNKSCQKKCICATGFVKKDGKCVTLASCPDHKHANITCLGTEDYTDCLPQCRQLCSGVQECDHKLSIKMCQSGCVCRGSYKVDSNGICVHNRHCFKTTDCPENEEWSKCVSEDNLCGMATIHRAPMRDQCFSGCICASGFARNSNGTCVVENKC